MDNSKLVRELNLQLIRTRKSFRQTVQRSFRQHNIDMTFEMLQVLHCLWQEEGISQQRLAAVSSKDKASLTSLLNNLEKKGWTERREDSADRRNRLIFLTAEGKALEQVIRPMMYDIYFFAGTKLDAAQIEEARSCLRKLSDIFNEI